MRRMLVQFDDDTYRRLRERAFRQERSMAAVVRELVSSGLEGTAKGERPTRVGQFSSVRVGRSTQGRMAPVSERHDDVLSGTYER